MPGEVEMETMLQEVSAIWKWCNLHKADFQPPVSPRFLSCNGISRNVTMSERLYHRDYPHFLTFISLFF